MPLETFIIMGRSGSGKGTQARLLSEYLEKKDPERRIYYLETGASFRKFLEGNSYSQRLSREIYERGGLQPEFLAIYAWSGLFIENLTGDEHLIIDGTPRRLHEASILTAAIQFYGRGRPKVVFLDVSRDWSKERLLARKRTDDNNEEIEKRLNWFDTEAMPAVDFFRDNPQCDFFEVNGEQTIEQVHADIITAIAHVNR